MDESAVNADPHVKIEDVPGMPDRRLAVLWAWGREITYRPVRARWWEDVVMKAERVALDLLSELKADLRGDNDAQTLRVIRPAPDFFTDVFPDEPMNPGRFGPDRGEPGRIRTSKREPTSPPPGGSGVSMSDEPTFAEREAVKALSTDALARLHRGRTQLGGGREGLPPHPSDVGHTELPVRLDPEAGVPLPPVPPGTQWPGSPEGRVRWFYGAPLTFDDFPISVMSTCPLCGEVLNAEVTARREGPEWPIGQMPDGTFLITARADALMHTCPLYKHDFAKAPTAAERLDEAEPGKLALPSEGDGAAADLVERVRVMLVRYARSNDPDTTSLDRVARIMVETVLEPLGYDTRGL